MELLYEKQNSQKSAIDSRFITIEASSLERNRNNLNNSHSNQSSHSYKKDAFFKTINNREIRNTSKERKNQPTMPNITNTRKSSKNRLDGINNSNFNTFNNLKENSSSRFTLKTNKNNNNNLNDYNDNLNSNNNYFYFYENFFNNTCENSIPNYKKTTEKQQANNLYRNESATKNLPVDKHKITFNDNNNNKMKNNENINFDNYITKSKSKLKNLSHRKQTENSINYKLNNSQFKIENSERPGSNSKIGSVSSKRNKKNEMLKEKQIKANKASEMYQAENLKLLMKMPTLKYENISKKPYNAFHKSYSAKIKQETRTASIKSTEEEEENPSETFSQERLSIHKLKSNQNPLSPKKQMQPLKTEDSREFTSKDSNLSNNNNNKNTNNNFSHTHSINNNYNCNNENLNSLKKTKKLDFNKLNNIKKLSNYMDFLQKEKKSEDLKSTYYFNNCPQADKNLSSSSRLQNTENDNSVFYTVNTECNSIGTTNLNSKNNFDSENISNSVSMNFLGNEYVSKLKSTFMQVNCKGNHLLSSMRDDKDNNESRINFNFYKINCDENFKNENRNINCDYNNDKNSFNYLNKNVYGNERSEDNNNNNNINKILTFEESKRIKNINFSNNSNCENKNNQSSKSKKKFKSVYNNNSNLSLRNYVVAKDSSIFVNNLKIKNRESSESKNQTRSKSRNNNSTINNPIKIKETKLNLNSDSSKEILNNNFLYLKSPKNLNSVSNNNDNNSNNKNIERNFNTISNSKLNSSALKNKSRTAFSKEKNLQKSNSKSNLIKKKENERPQTAIIMRMESAEKLEKQQMLLNNKPNLIEKNTKNNLMISSSNNKNNHANTNDNNNYKNNNSKAKDCFIYKNNNNTNLNDTNNINYNTEKTIHINHNFNHNINHNILINIENPEGLSAENFKKSLEKFHSKKNNQNNSSVQSGKNTTGAQKSKLNYNLNLEAKKKNENFSEINYEYLNTDNARISGCDRKMKDIINSLEFAKESNVNLKNYKKNYRNIVSNSNNNKNFENFYANNYGKEKEKENFNNHKEKSLSELTNNKNLLARSQKNLNLKIPNPNNDDKNTYNSLNSPIANVNQKAKNLISVSSINLKNDCFNNKDFRIGSSEIQNNFSTRIVNNNSFKLASDSKKELSDTKNENKNEIIEVQKSITDINSVKKSIQLNNKSLQLNNKSIQLNNKKDFTIINNNNNKITDELKYSLTQKQISSSKDLKDNSNSINFQKLRKNLIATNSNNNNNDNNNNYNSNSIKNNNMNKDNINVVSYSDPFKFDKMEFFKSKNKMIELEEVEETDFSKEAVNTEPVILSNKNIYNIKNPERAEDFIKNLNLNKSNFAFSKEEGKLVFLDNNNNKLKQNNLNTISISNSNFNLISKSELKKDDKNQDQSTKPAAKPFLLSESVNISFKPFDFLKKQTFFKNKNFNSSLKFKKNVDNSPKENPNKASINNFDTVCVNKGDYLNNAITDENENFNKNNFYKDGNFNVNEKFNLFKIHKKLNLAKSKNGLFDSFSNNNNEEDDGINEKQNQKLNNNSNNAITDEESNPEVFPKKAQKDSNKLNSRSIKNSSSSKSKSKSKSYSGSHNKDKESIPKDKDILEQTISYIISDDEPISKGNKSNLILNTEESDNNNFNNNFNKDNNKNSLFYINNSNDEVDFEKFYEEMNLKLMSD